MKKYTFSILAALAITFSATSCTEDFEETNVNPNLISEITAGSVLNPVIYNLVSNNTSKNYDITAQLMQVHIPFPSNALGVHRYDITQGTGNSTWSTTYNNLINIEEMLKVSREKGDVNYEAIALTLRAWMMSNLTDMFGDVPFSEAGQGELGNFTPKFDSQQEIYTALLSDLENANALYQNNLGMKYGADILFNGDVTKWKKFTNSLHLRLLLRVSNKAEMNSFQKMSAILNDPSTYPVFTSNLDAAVLQVTGIAPNVSPWQREQDYRDNRAFASFFINNLNEINDPRLAKFTTHATDNNGISIGYKGVDAAYEGNSSQFDFTPSRPNTDFVTEPMKLVLMSYAEVEFIKAELAQKGFYSDAETHYINGVKAAISLWTDLEPTEEYLAQEKVAYNGTLEQIMTQKYYALFFTDFQQWYEYRRTGFPVLPTTNTMLNNKKVPNRLLYPTSAQNLNTANYNQAVQNMGGDRIDVKVWWENN